MADFFERLLAEEDPTRFAAMAETLPEPPPFDGPSPERDPSWTRPPRSRRRPSSRSRRRAEAVAEPAVEAAAERRRGPRGRRRADRP